MFLALSVVLALSIVLRKFFLTSGATTEWILVYHQETRDVLHSIATPGSVTFIQDLQSFAAAPITGGSLPYLFALGYKDGSVRILSIQSNNTLDKCGSARFFEIHDGREGIFFAPKPVSTVGKSLILPPPTIPETAESDSGGASGRTA